MSTLYYRVEYLDKELDSYEYQTWEKRIKYLRIDSSLVDIDKVIVTEFGSYTPILGVYEEEAEFY